MRIGTLREPIRHRAVNTAGIKAGALIMMKTYDMSRVHEANLTILKEIDRICRKYNIRYMLDAGTL